jgi:hypothetical protein
MELKLRFIFIISCWPGGPTPLLLIGLGGVRIGNTWGPINLSEDYLRYRAQLGYARQTISLLITSTTRRYLQQMPVNLFILILRVNFTVTIPPYLYLLMFS